MINKTLTPEYIHLLQEKREASPEDFHLHIRSLRASGWPLSCLAEAFSVSKTAISKWESKPDPSNPLPSVPPYTDKPELSVFEKEHLRLLTKASSKVRRFTHENSPAKKSARLLEAELRSYRDQGLTVTELARYCGVTRRAVAQRLEKTDGI